MDTELKEMHMRSLISPAAQTDPNAPFNNGSTFSGKRASWRELIR